MELLHPGSFPDQAYLRRRALKMIEVLATHDPAAEIFTVVSDALLQWQGAYVTDLSMEWSYEELSIDDLYLTGMNPEWNTIILDMCQRSPKRLRKLLELDPATRAMVDHLHADDEPIMVRADFAGKLAVLDGMNRTVAAIGRGETTIAAFVGRRSGKPMLQISAGIAYSFCRSYRIGALDEDGLVAVLSIMRSTYHNMDALLERFKWEPDLRPIIARVLNEPYRPTPMERIRLWLKRWLH